MPVAAARGRAANGRCRAAGSRSDSRASSPCPARAPSWRCSGSRLFAAETPLRNDEVAEHAQATKKSDDQDERDRELAAPADPAGPLGGRLRARAAVAAAAVALAPRSRRRLLRPADRRDAALRPAAAVEAIGLLSAGRGHSAAYGSRAVQPHRSSASTSAGRRSSLRSSPRAARSERRARAPTTVVRRRTPCSPSSTTRVEELRTAQPDTSALGFGIPSRVDQRTGRAVASVNVPLTDVDFRDRMRERHGLPVAIDNDANAAAIAEWQDRRRARCEQRRDAHARHRHRRRSDPRRAALPRRDRERRRARAHRDRARRAALRVRRARPSRGGAPPGTRRARSRRSSTARRRAATDLVQRAQSRARTMQSEALAGYRPPARCGDRDAS